MTIRGAALALALTVPGARADVLVERTLLPDATPSSFAIALPGGVNFCFDPVRGGVRYVWRGGFLDLTPVRPGMGKLTTPAKLLGTLMHQEAGLAPLRRGDPTRTPAVEFKGYTVRATAIEFRYTLDGVLVHEEIAARADGTGLTRRFRSEGATDAQWWYVTAGRPAISLTVTPGGTIAHDIAFTPHSP